MYGFFLAIGVKTKIYVKKSLEIQVSILSKKSENPIPVTGGS